MEVKNKPDVIVVGAGAGGAAVAWRLVEQGLNVLMLEAGERFNPSRDYKLHQADWERHQFPQTQASQGAVTVAKLDKLAPANHDLMSWNKSRGTLIKDNTRQPAGKGYIHVQGVGGSTLHFVGESHRLNPASMKLKTQFGVGHDWPIDYETLEPYYIQAEKLIGVAGPTEQPSRWRSEPFPLPPHPLSTSAQALVKAGSELGMHWQENSRAALSRPYDGRPACNYCGNCSRGCPIGDKGSADVTFVRHAEATGRLMVKSLCSVTDFDVAEDGRINSLSYVVAGKKHHVAAPVVVLAAGAVQTPRLLLSAKSHFMPNGLANRSGQVGKNFMETLFWSSTGIISEVANTHMGLPADAICWDFNSPDAINGVVGGCRFYSSTREMGFNGPIAYATRSTTGFGRQLKAQVREQFGRAVSVGAIAEFLPNPQSYIDLDETKKDENGIAYPRIHSHLTQQDITRLRFMAEQSRALLKQANATLVEEYGTFDYFATTHVFGTCKMGDDPSDSVVNSECQSHDHPNLFITDASVFPSTGGGEAPSLTIQALAIRAADYIAERFASNS